MAVTGKKKNIIIGVSTVMVLGIFYFVYQHIFYVSTDNAQVQAKTVMLASKVGGFVTKVAVEENQKVKAGELLAEIDSRDYDNTLHQMIGERESVQARAHNAATNSKRLQSLYSQGAISQQQNDAATATNIELVNKIKSLDAQIAQAQLNLDNTKIKAPTDGSIAKKAVELGQLASPGMPLFGFVSAEERWVSANFKETELEGLRIGQKVDVTVDAISGRTFHGEVESVSSATGATFTLLPPDNATGNFTKVVQRVPVRIKLGNLSNGDVDLLQAGLSANVKVHVR